ncbi:NADP-dependent phosphogluconate dehydrogenase [Pikeienuella piscinae]|uniref:6-phosphogluconate dehydrogenase, decarboxylating n=1 Tax=Pikeienuella piscinae TaxID=2748098 RepID=A0A7M3T592_9RHOB|nr:NADP-dependent phosphogluconate dehydrogenase [Pikeienuella piscinae]QIE57173.1 NADP-dependent phosphogluconate dehydrogenase [Pikeienuella piscinae]
MKADIGLIGVGVMGASLALNMAEHGYRVAAHDRDFDKMQGARDAAEGMSGVIEVAEAPEALIAAIRPPRAIIILVPAGAAVDAIIAQFRPLLSEGDLLIDAGNANFHDTRRRTAALEAEGLAFLGIGVSGGAEGARRGPSIMAGGSPALWGRVEEMLKAIAARHDDTPCCDWFGPDGAGHFVKTVHNGIEYADMQMIADGYGVMRDGLGMEPGAIADVFESWRGGPLASYLVDITAEVLATTDAGTGRPLVDLVQDRAGQKGTGGWAALEALRLAAPAPAIEAAVAARNLSARKTERTRLEAIFGPAARPLGDALGTEREAVADIRDAILAGRIAAYAQGFEILRAASVEYGWAMNFAAIARVWRAGCIIRAALLDDIAVSLEAAPETNLIGAPLLSEMMRGAENGLRRTVSAAAARGLPAPALASSLSYFDQLRTARGTANLIQLQRDFFGRHGFERLDRDGAGLHGPWA